jgi:protein ImuA
MPRPTGSSLAALRDRIRHMERPARHGVLPFDVAAIDLSLPGGGLALGALHEITGAGGDEEDGAAAAGFAAGILARLGPRPTSPSQRFALGPSLSPLQGGEGKSGRHSDSLSARHGSLGGGEDPHPSLPRKRGRVRKGAGGGEGGPPNGRPQERVFRGEVGDARAWGIVLWCLKRPDLYGPGLLAHGLDPARLVLVAARRDDEILWAVEEGLRSGLASGLAAVVGEIGQLPMVAGRRLQLAAERSGVTAFILRRWRNAAEAMAERDRPSAALTRWRVAALPQAKIGPQARIADEPGIGQARWRVELRRVRGGAPGIWDVEAADATGHVCLSAELADRPAAPARPDSYSKGAEPLQQRTG